MKHPAKGSEKYRGEYYFGAKFCVHAFAKSRQTKSPDGAMDEFLASFGEIMAAGTNAVFNEAFGGMHTPRMAPSESRRMPPESHEAPGFRADAVNTLDEVMEYAEALGGRAAALLDKLTDEVARGDMTEREAILEAWPWIAVASSADKVCESGWTIVRCDADGSGRREWIKRRVGCNDKLAPGLTRTGKFSMANQLARIVNPRWEVSHL